MSRIYGWSVMAGALLMCISCGGKYQPKPKGYNRFILPEPVYVAMTDTLPYCFEYSKYAVLQPDTSRIRDKYWLEIFYPQWMATIHITYKQLHNDHALLRSYADDAYTLTAKHQIKAYAIDESVVHTPGGKTALVVEIEGQTPSQFQFTITDSSHHFLRGALYFNLKVQNDSLRPAIEYVKKDIIHLINTLEWKEP